MDASDPSDWYRDAVVYQLHVKAFADANGDGIGDFPGLTVRLDHLSDLGVTAVWLLPFYPSPLRDDGYDIADYTGVHPSYGTLRDVKRFLTEAHRRGIRVITELVVNHTSDQHPWFQRARRARPGTAARDFYVWSPTNQRYSDARIIFQDFEVSNWTWDHVAGAYYWHRFYSHQPDLNFENPAVHEAILKALDFWMALGVDGLRLDAVPYLYEREGTICENLPETHAFLKMLRAHVDARWPGRMLLAEANQWPEDAVAYFGDGDECHMAFHFPVMPRLFMGVRQEDRFPIVDILSQTPAIPEGCQWATFLRNHDELTLEMVTDEERDYMVRAYAHDPQARINLGIRRRLAPLLDNDRRRIELLNGLLFSLPGTPVVYYGDEIGMGDNVYLGDRNGVRTPMQWDDGRNAGFSDANPQQLYLPVVLDPRYQAPAVNVAAQRADPSSLLRWMRQLISLRRRHPAFGRGTLEFCLPDDPKVLAFWRVAGDDVVLVVANLSGQARQVALPLAPWAGRVPVELFGRTEFATIGEAPWVLSLGPHSFSWFALEQARSAADTEEPVVLDLPAGGDGDGDTRRAPEVATVVALAGFARALPGYLARQPWFSVPARAIVTCEVTEVVGLGDLGDTASAAIVLVRVDTRDGEPTLHQLPLVVRTGEAAHRVCADAPGRVIARLAVRGRPGPVAVVADGAADDDVMGRIAGLLARRRGTAGRAGAVVGTLTSAFRTLAADLPVGGGRNDWTRGNGDALLGAVRPLAGGHTHASALIGDRLLLRLNRRVEEGVDPAVEVGLFLGERTGTPQVPRVAGHLSYRPRQGTVATLGVVTEFVPGEGDHWHLTVDTIARALRELGDPPTVGGVVPAPPGVLLDRAALIGRRTAELHLALAPPDGDDPAFHPEPFSPMAQRSLLQSVRTMIRRRLPQLRRRLDALAPDDRALAETVLAAEAALLERGAWLTGERIGGMRIRIHGDYHLAQVLSTGRDVTIVGFEGETDRPIGERRLKRTPLRDVAAMLRSFDRASATALRQETERGTLPGGDDARRALADTARAWVRQCAEVFEEAYRTAPGIERLLPADPGQGRRLLELCLLERAIDELGDALDRAPGELRPALAALAALAAPAAAPAG